MAWKSRLGVFYRWKPRDIGALCDSHAAGSRPVIHLSALERIAHGTDGYNPGTLTGEVNVTFTRSHDPDQTTAAVEDAAAGVRAELVETALRNAFAERAANLDAIKHTLWIGRTSYYLYVASCAGALIALSVPEGAESITPWVLLRSASVLVFNAVTGQWGSIIKGAVRVLSTPSIIGVLLAAFALSAELAMYVDRLRSKTFSRFWHTSRQELREALKESRKRMHAPRVETSAVATSSGPE